MTDHYYLSRILQSYQESYDLTVPYTCGNTAFAAYGHFYARQEKYMLVREVKMWESNGFDHVFFLEVDTATEHTIADMDRIIRQFAEPELVRGGRKYPVENHMYSDITYVILSKGRIEEPILKPIQNYRFGKNYLFTLRGWCDARVVAVDLSENRVYGNRRAKKLIPFYRMLFD
ncbi:MAG: hypothetical protein ACRDBO_22285 [Lachnospiraceae bacterium]